LIALERGIPRGAARGRGRGRPDLHKHAGNHR